MFRETLGCIINFSHFAGLYPLTTNMLKHRLVKKKKKRLHFPLHPKFLSFPTVHFLKFAQRLHFSSVSSLALEPTQSGVCAHHSLHFTCPCHGLQWPAHSSFRGPFSDRITPPISNTDIIDGPLPPPWNTFFLPLTPGSPPTSLACPSHSPLAGCSSSQSETY